MSQLGNFANLQVGALGNPAAPGGQGAASNIGGALNFGSVPSPSDYMGAYGNALSLNQQNYSNILAGYGQTMQNQQQAQRGIQQGYGDLYGTVMGTIQGIGASQSQAIQDAYAQQSGASSQQMIDRGLGNTTVQQSVQRGNLYDKQKADIGLANQMAQLTAGYQSNLGMAGLNYANQANMQNTGLASQQLGWMNSVNSPYPNAQAYGQLAIQQGYANRANQLAGRVMGGGTFGAGGGGGRAGGGPPSSGPGRPTGSSSFQQQGGGGGFGGGAAGNRRPVPQQGENVTLPNLPGEPGAGPFGVDQYGNPIQGEPGAGPNGVDRYGNPLPVQTDSSELESPATDVSGDGAPDWGGGGSYDSGGGGDYYGG